MAVFKVTKSGNGVLFIGDDGTVFCTSKVMVQRMLSHAKSHEFLVLTRLSGKVSMDRFPPSVEYNALSGKSSVVDANVDGSVKPSQDVLAQVALERSGKVDKPVLDVLL